MSEYDLLPHHCGIRSERVICAPAIHKEISPYRSPATGKIISSRAAQREDLLASGSLLNEPGLSADISRWKEASAEKAFAPIAAAVDNVVTTLVTSGAIES